MTRELSIGETPLWRIIPYILHIAIRETIRHPLGCDWCDWLRAPNVIPELSIGWTPRKNSPYDIHKYTLLHFSYNYILLMLKLYI
jgi:hypothetical protein